MKDETLSCPNCKSKNLHSGKKGYSVKKGALGWVITGGVGLIGGLIGSNQIIITCLDCGRSFKPGDKLADYSFTEPSEIQSTDVKIPTKSTPPPRVNQRSKCSHCGSINDLGVKYCRACGVKINYDNLEVIRNGQVFEYCTCPTCEHRTAKASKKNRFCTNCSKELQQTIS